MHGACHPSQLSVRNVDSEKARTRRTIGTVVLAGVGLNYGVMASVDDPGEKTHVASVHRALRVARARRVLPGSHNSPRSRAAKSGMERQRSGNCTYASAGPQPAGRTLGQVEQPTTLSTSRPIDPGEPQ